MDCVELKRALYAKEVMRHILMYVKKSVEIDVIFTMINEMMEI